VINLITTLSYSVRIVGIRTGRVAISFALFNILVLVSRTANGFQAPLLAKTVENDIKVGIFDNIGTFRLIIFSCSLATIIGAFLIPTFQRVLSKAVINFSSHKSMGKLLLHGFSKAGILYFKDNMTIPNKENYSQIKLDNEFPWRIFILNIPTFAKPKNVSGKYNRHYPRLSNCLKTGINDFPFSVRLCSICNGFC
jgi:hypothetical protein